MTFLAAQGCRTCYILHILMRWTFQTASIGKKIPTTMVVATDLQEARLNEKKHFALLQLQFLSIKALQLVGQPGWPCILLFLAVVRFGFQGYGPKPMPPVQYLPFCQRKAASRSLQFCIGPIVSQWFCTIRTLRHEKLPTLKKGFF